ncbi:MAG: peptidylprolyl isomerase [Motiliproteus sp.]
MQAQEESSHKVRLQTNMGDIILQLNAEKAPKTVANFEAYVNKGFYDGLIFHRIISNFMIQGGGFRPALIERPAEASITNEADNGLSNSIGTIAMARRQDPHSASAQFFINTNDNRKLDFSSRSPQGWGYAVFGEVTEGMDIVEKIKNVDTQTVKWFKNVPIKDVIIVKAEMLP